MISYLPTDTNIPPAINQHAALAGVGAPVQAFRAIWLRILTIIFLIIFIACIAWIGYTIYAYFSFISLTHLYPNIADIPSNQLDHYTWMQTLHDDFWKNVLSLARLLLVSLGFVLACRVGFTRKLYLCTEGLLLIKKGQTQTIRWDQVQELHTSDGIITSLRSKNGTSFIIPKAYFYLKENRAIGTWIIDEITRIRLPQLMEQLGHGETISIGPLHADKMGIARTGVQLPWHDIAVSEIDHHSLKVFGYQPKHAYAPKALRWYKWASDTAVRVHDLPLINALINTTITLGQSSAQLEHIQVWQSMAVSAKRQQKRRYWLIVSGVIALIIFLLAGMTYSLITYSNQQAQLTNQRAARDLILMQNNVKKLAQHPYVAAIPGVGCDQGQGNWLNDDDTNIYKCLPDGLHMTQKNMQYQDELYFNFDKGTDFSTGSQHLFTGQFVPHHYQLQIKATITSGGQDTCVAIHFHIQQFGGRQEFRVCDDNTWYYTYCDTQCNNEVQFANGNLPRHNTNPYLITVDVTDMLQTLYVDHTKITSIKDSGYSTTDEVALGVYGDTGTNPGAVFSDFRYTPFTRP